MGDKTLEMAISLGFSVIGLILQYLQTAGVTEAVIDANWATVKAEHFRRPSSKLPEIPETEEEPA